MKKRLSAEPEESVKEDKIEFTKDAVKKYLDDCISYWRENGTEISKYYIDAYQSVRISLFDEPKQPEEKDEEMV